MIDADRLKVSMRVRYIRAYSSQTTESGTVSSWNKDYVFMKFNKTVHRLSMAGSTAQACRRHDLLEIDHEHNDRIQTWTILGRTQKE